MCNECIMENGLSETLEQLIDGLPVVLKQGDVGVSVAGLTDDSRCVGPGMLYIARKGTVSDGADYIANAIAAGASAVLTLAEEVPGVSIPEHVVHVHSSASQMALMSELAARFYGRASERLKLIGITGTNGKTTSAYMVRHLLNELGVKTGMIGTVEIDDGDGVRAATLTTPGVIELEGIFAKMVEHGCEACVMEVSSHALHQGRVGHLDFAAALFTNLSGDHLDYHKTIEHYAQSKAILFECLGEDAVAVVNAVDQYAGLMMGVCKGRVVRFSNGELDGVDYRASVLRATAEGTEFELCGPMGEMNLNLPLIGGFNVTNMLGAVGVVVELMNEVSVSRLQLKAAIEGCPRVPGRLERVSPSGHPFTVLVDYAHTDDALLNALSAVRPLTEGRLWVVFGCGGDRDQTKRPRMGEVACELADRLVITSDNPRTEDPEQILAHVRAGVDERRVGDTVVEVDRAKAIGIAIDGAEAGDVVLIAGKGHEDYQIIGTEKIHFDDREQAIKAIESNKLECGS